MLPFRSIWAVDFEYNGRDGDRPSPVCLVARELRSGQLVRLWHDELGPEPPYPLTEQDLFVAFNAAAEFSCHRVLGWPMPARTLDLMAEFRQATNWGNPMVDRPFGGRLPNVMQHYGLDGISVEE